MKKFEDEMQKFSHSLFLGEQPISLDERKARIFAVWISFITILAEYVGSGKDRITVSQEDRDFIKKYRSLPEKWTIVACSSNSSKWWARYRHRSIWIRNFHSVTEYYNAEMSRGS